MKFNLIKNTEGFIKRAQATHGDKYDYSKVCYKRPHDKVEIICPIHGVFLQQAWSHLLGRGCAKCSSKNSPRHQKGVNSLTQDEFIKKAKLKHGEKYDYSRVVYKKMSEKVDVICPKHGVFKIRASSHIQGCGCRKCAFESIHDHNRKDTEYFIKEAQKIHGDKYDYSKTEYIAASEPVVITCPKHGDFLQRPTAHLAGCGCKLCKNSLGENRISIYLKKHNIEFEAQKRYFNECLFCKNKIIIVDFYIPSKNVIIEFNGIQHYREKDSYFNFKKRNFEEQQERDHALRLLCKEHKIKLIEISYKEIDKIEEILNKEFNLK